MGYLSVIVVLLVLISFPSPMASLVDNESSDSLVFGLMRVEIQTQTAEVVETSALLRIARKRSSRRFHALRKMLKNVDSKALNISERLGIYRDGYVMSLRLGSPAQSFQVYMDTGSDLVWVPCLNFSKPTFFDCIGCEKYHKRIDTFYPLHSRSSNLESCDSSFCLDIHTSEDPYDTCIMAGCSLKALHEGSCSVSCPPFSYRYGDGIVTAQMIRERIVVKGSPIEKICNFCFGCAVATLNEPIGIAGFGRGALSFPSQLGSALSYRAFCYCLISYRYEQYNSNVSSPLVLGASAVPVDDGLIQYTPMLSNPIYPNYYYIGLQGISIGNKYYLEVPLSLQEIDSEGNGGMIIDSGTTYTHLPASLYRKILATLEAIIPYPRCLEYEKRTSFDLCYLVFSSQSYQGLPTLTYYFQNNVTLILPIENHFYAFSAAGIGIANSKVHCLMLQSFDDVDVYGFAAILGNFQQQNIQVVYDMEKSRIGFEPKNCSSDHPTYNDIYN